jgi:hypothetical protein
MSIVLNLVRFVLFNSIQLKFLNAFQDIRKSSAPLQQVTKLIVYGFARTGSNYFCEVMNRHPDILMHYEVFHKVKAYFTLGILHTYVIYNIIIRIILMICMRYHNFIILNLYCM